METIYKVGDRVYDRKRQSWGIIVKIDDNPMNYYPIDVKFDDGETASYTLDDIRYIDNIPVLSFTEYNLGNGGLSRESTNIKTMETIFKINDRVYDGTIGLWGTIVKIDDNPIDNYPIDVDFGDNILETYTLDGRKYMDNMPVLSFTKYDLVNGGFSQVRPYPEIEKDQLVYVRIIGEREWKLRYFSHFDENGKLCFFCDQEKSAEATSTVEATEYSLENPLI